MTIPEASRLVITAGAMARGGEIFVLNMGEPVRIYDLAEYDAYEDVVSIDIERSFCELVGMPYDNKTYASCSPSAD